MSDTKKEKKIAISSQSQDDRYHREASKRKAEKMGVSPLIMRMYRDD